MNIRMSTKGKRPLRSLTPSDKIHAIQRIHDGESKASVARDIGVPESTLRGWCKNEDKLRFMSRQSVSDKMAAETLSDKMDGSGGLLGGPPEKRQKMDASMPLNFSNKIKFDELAYKRSPLNGLDFSTNKALSEFGSFNGLTPDYAAFNGAVKNKMFGADIARQGQNDPSLAAISPLTSLSHLSGLTGIGHSPLAISFNELTSNLSLLAQLNPGLAAMSGLNGLAANNNAMRNIKPKSNPAPVHSPRSDRGCSGGSGNSSGGERQGLSVRNWAKQKPPTPTSSLESNTGLNLSQPELKNKMKCPSPSLAPSLGNNLPPMPSLTDDPLLYWLKSQQAMLGLNNLYPQANFDVTSPPIRSSTPQQQSQQANTPPISSTPLTPSSTPSGSLDDKNSAWFNWCKAFGASISSLAPAAAAAALQAHPLNQVPTSSTNDGPNGDLNEQQNGNDQKPFENILYSHLTKDTDSNSIKSFSTVDNVNSNEVTSNTGKPEDLSAKTTKSISPAPSPLPTPAQSPDQSQPHSLNTSRTPSPVNQSEDIDTITPMNNRHAVAKDVLDDILYKINKNAPNNSFECRNMRESMERGSDSNNSYNSNDSNHNHHNLCENNNNNNNSNKTDEEERMKNEKYNMNEEDGEESEAIRHGEKFLKWLENCSNPRVTTVQLMQLRFLITAIKSNSESSKTIQADIQSANSTTTDEIYEDGSRSKGRRRK